MVECIHKTEENVEKGNTITFENKTDTAFDVSAGIVFRKSGLYRVTVIDKTVSVEIEQERTAKPKKGKWLEFVDDRWGSTYYICSECRKTPLIGERTSRWCLSNFCPNCGARMGEDDNE